MLLHYQEQGVSPPSDLSLHFVEFLSALAALYSKDPLQLELSLDYWCSMENSNLSYRLPHRQVNILIEYRRFLYLGLSTSLKIPLHIQYWLAGVLKNAGL